MRRRWRASRSSADVDVLTRDERVYLKQAVSTPCLATIVGAEGSYLIGSDGTRYLDFHGNSAHQIGYGHPRLVAALEAQLKSLPFAPRRFTSPDNSRNSRSTQSARPSAPRRTPISDA